MAKSMLVTLPLVLFLMDYWPLARFRLDIPIQTQWHNIRKLILEKIPYLTIACLFSIIAIAAGNKAVNQFLPFNIRIGNAIQSYLIYLQKTFWPSNLSIFYPYPVEITVWPILTTCFILAGITGLALWMRKRFPFLIAGWLWYLITLIPVLGIIQVGTQAYADRYTYIPLIGIFVMICWTIPLLARNLPYCRILIYIGGGILLITCIVISRAQVSYWQDSNKLMTHALEVTQNNYVAQTSLGIVLMKKGQTAEAINHFEEAIRINPLYAYAQNNLGLLLSQQGRVEEALPHLNEAIQINPNYADAYSNLADLLRRTNRNEEALEACRKALEINPYHANTHAILGAILVRQGKTTEAIEQLNEAIQINPDLPEAHLILAILLIAQGKLEEAADHLRSTIQSKPDTFLAHYYLGLISKTQGRFDEAAQHFQDTLRLRPDFEKAKDDLRNVMTLQRKIP